MSKSETRPSKRRKLGPSPVLKHGDIRGAFELDDLLRFKQSTGPEVKAGVDNFRKFLADISTNKDQEERKIQLQVLKHYCDDQLASNKDEVDFPDVILTWSFASQSNVERIISAVPAALAQFLELVSNELDFREFGLSLCHTLLKRDQARLIERGLSAGKSKEHLITPCLKLLTEIVSFDGGALASSVFNRRDLLLRRLDDHLNPGHINRRPGDTRRPSTRLHAQRLLLELLKYLDVEARIELVGQAKTLHSCIRHLKHDDPDIVSKVLDALKLYLVNADMPKPVKIRFLNSATLALIADLYNYEGNQDIDKDGVDASSPNSVREAAHHFLIHACTSENGIVQPQAGWFPLGFRAGASTSDDDDDMIDLGLDSPYYSDDYSSSVPIKNAILATFLQRLTPEKDQLQAELLTKTFFAAPELVADYFSKRHNLPLQPTNDDTWQGSFAFLFSVIQLPVPENFGHSDRLPASPPPLSVMVENIVPRSLDRSTITHYLKDKDQREILVLSGARLITRVLGKLDAVLLVLKQTPHHSLWQQAAQSLLEIVAGRLPVFADVVAALRSTSKAKLTLRGALFECLAAYKEIPFPPRMTSSIDCSGDIMDVIAQLRNENLENDEGAPLLPQLDDLMVVARSSNATRWWHKSSLDELSVITHLLAHAAIYRCMKEIEPVPSTVQSILEAKGIINFGLKSFVALLTSVRIALSKNGTTMSKDDVKLLQFLDTCMDRISKRPVAYLEQMEMAQDAIEDEGSISLLICALVEQWPFLLKREPNIQWICEWASQLFSLLEDVEESSKLLEYYKNRLLTASDEYPSQRRMLENAFKKQRTHINIDYRPPEPLPPENDRTTPRTPTPPPTKLPATFAQPPPLSTTLSSLTQWSSPNFELELSHPSTSRLASLIRLLSSHTQELRLTSLSTLTTITHHLSSPSQAYRERTPLNLLLSELIESFRHYSSDNPNNHLPHLATELTATFLLPIIVNPADKMYRKANQFLLSSPTWTPLTRLIPYWTRQILLLEPDVDEPFAEELELTRFLTWLSNSLRSADDMELIRRSGVFERLGSLYLSPMCRREHRKQVLELVYRATDVQGGADTLVTRAGVRAWLQIVKVREQGMGDKEMVGVVEGLERKVQQCCSAKYIREWEMKRKALEGLQDEDGKRRDENVEMGGA